jgi:hypothetical protein
MIKIIIIKIKNPVHIDQQIIKFGWELFTLVVFLTEYSFMLDLLLHLWVHKLFVS